MMGNHERLVGRKHKADGTTVGIYHRHQRLDTRVLRRTSGSTSSLPRDSLTDELTCPNNSPSSDEQESTTVGRNVLTEGEAAVQERDRTRMEVPAVGRVD
jgi:hypothetical protein